MRLGPALALSLFASGATACADASGRFQAFEDRRADVSGAAGERPAGGGGADAGCQPPAPGVVDGPALLAIETATVPGAAILFFGDLETLALDDEMGFKFSYQALSVTDRRTRVGERLVVGPYVIEDDGSFDAPTEESTLPGSANALSPGLPITSQLTLHGTICEVSDFYCGTVTGKVTAPIEAETTGRFGLTLVRSLDDLPSRPRFGCEADALAPALE